MAKSEPNYVKEVFSSQWNLGFIGIMFLLMVTVNFIGFGALLLGGQVVAFLLAQMPIVQHYIRLKAQIDDKENIKLREQELVTNLPPEYQNDFESVKYLCEEIENRWKTQGNSGNFLMSDLINKLGTFRFEYARMLQAHHLSSSRNVVNLTQKLQNELKLNEEALGKEKSPKVREVLAQNVRIIKQRLQRTMQLSDLLRLLAARLSVVKNSLNLLHDEVYTVADPENMSSQVDNLLLTLNIDEELKATYEDVLGDSSANQVPAPLSQNANQQAKRQSNLRRIK
ncbi:MAG TPA: hypothetical protein PKY59_02070 [Pyrinomonadaceae bacterium]|nr:hypothetical protein [Pyrinomonadaceae bacterium]